MSDDPLRRLAAADPARTAALPDAMRTALHERVLATPPAEAPRRRRRRARPTGLTIAIGLGVVAAGAGAAAFVASQSTDEVVNDYNAATHSIPLPAGYAWPGFPKPPADEPTRFGGDRAGEMQAMFQALCAWQEAWLDAPDTPGRAAALAGWRKVYPLIPIHHAGESEDRGGMDSSTVAYTRGLEAAMAEGRRAPVSRDLAINCTVRPTKQP